MPERPYSTSEHAFGRGRAADDSVVRALQHDLRATGYLEHGIDGVFGPATARAVRALTHDLVHNSGEGPDGKAAVPVVHYNEGGRIRAATETVNRDVADCLARMAADPAFPKLPESADPHAANARLREESEALSSTVAPAPWMIEMLRQESGLRHFHEPRAGDADRFVIVGMDRNGTSRDAITSRGYGVGQHTLFHHPPRREEVEALIADPLANLRESLVAFRRKFDRFVNAASPAARADDRIAEIGDGALRLCRYAPGDPRHMRDCRTCAREAPTARIEMGAPYYPGAAGSLRHTRYYRSPERYENVPRRDALDCDWPYAARRYNGSGPNSYHYQTRILLRLAGRSW